MKEALGSARGKEALKAIDGKGGFDRASANDGVSGALRGALAGRGGGGGKRRGGGGGGERGDESSIAAWSVALLDIAAEGDLGAVNSLLETAIREGTVGDGAGARSLEAFERAGAEEVPPSENFGPIAALLGETDHVEQELAAAIVDRLLSNRPTVVLKNDRDGRVKVLSSVLFQFLPALFSALR